MTIFVLHSFIVFFALVSSFSHCVTITVLVLYPFLILMYQLLLIAYVVFVSMNVLIASTAMIIFFHTFYVDVCACDVHVFSVATMIVIVILFLLLPFLLLLYSVVLH